MHGRGPSRTIDGEILRAAAAQRLTLVTYDQNTLLTHMAELVSEGFAHGGIIVVDETSIPQNDVGGMARSLCALSRLLGDADWTNRCFFLQPPRK